jgi:hypothetical protein
MPVFRRFVVIALVVMVVVVSLPMAAAASSPERVTERYIDASFDNYLNACISAHVWVEGVTVARQTGSSLTQTAGINMDIFVYDHCTGLEVLSTSGSATVPFGSAQISPGLNPATVNGVVPVFVPKGPGYTLELSVSLAFSATGKLEVNRYATGVGMGRKGNATAQIILPALCGVVFCSDVNLTPEPVYNAQASQLLYLQK